MAFAFGKNWKNYLKTSYDDKALKRSMESLENFIGIDNLVGKTFLDIGCGSGVHSLAAIKLGASKVLSIDVDEDSIECCKELSEKEGFNSRWEIKTGSLVNDEFILRVGNFDVVYCWGVAHHTGDMQKALGNLEKTIKPGGFLYLAIYNKVNGIFGSHWWFIIKKFYNGSNFFVKKTMEIFYISWHYLLVFVRYKKPFEFLENFKKKRGMNFRNDLIDWLGGYPYEFASPEEIFDFYKNKGLSLIKMRTTNSIGNNSFLFKK